MAAPGNPDPPRAPGSSDSQPSRFPKLVIFDCDGVLVDSEGISGDVLARALTAAGLATSSAEALREYKGLLMAEVIDQAQARLGAALPEGFADAFERERTVEFQGRLQPVPGARETVKSLRAAGIKTCVASQGRLEKTDLSLKLTGLRDLFAENELFSAYMVARGKPHPDLFLHAAASMRTSPDQCVVVEDTAIGVRAAHSAGMRAYGYAADSDGEQLRRAGADVLRSLADLPERIGLPRMMRDVPIRGEVIRLGQLLKLAGVIDSGAEVKAFLLAEPVWVNEAREGRRGRQLHPGDVVRAGGHELRLTSAPPDFRSRS